MKARKPPILATWLLDLSGRVDESVTGDLIEQYQQGRGRLWYWRQVIAIVLVRVYKNTASRPLISTHRLPMGVIVTAVFIILSLTVVLLSDIGPLLLTPVVIGCFIACLRYIRTTQSPPVALPGAQADKQALVRIDSSKISIRGGLGAGILIVILLTAALHDVALLRVWALPGLLAGPLVALLLRVWAKHHPRDLDKEWPSILPK